MSINQLDLADIAEILPPYRLLKSHPSTVWVEAGELAPIERGLLLAYNSDSPYSCTRAVRVHRVQRACDMPEMGVQSARAVANMLKLLDAMYDRVQRQMKHECYHLQRQRGRSAHLYQEQFEWALETWQFYMDMGWPWLAGNKPMLLAHHLEGWSEEASQRREA